MPKITDAGVKLAFWHGVGCSVQSEIRASFYLCSRVELLN